MGRALCIALACDEVLAARRNSHKWKTNSAHERALECYRVCDSLEMVEATAIAGVEGDMKMHFPLSIWQTGSGTHTNMNVNEVVARRAEAIAAELDLCEAEGKPMRVHPNDDVNVCQSSNDTFPSAAYIAAAVDALRLAEVCRRARAALDVHVHNTRSIIKLGRTHMRDATPLPLALELQVNCEALSRAAVGLERAAGELCDLPLGGTAVGTGLNTYQGKFFFTFRFFFSFHRSISYIFWVFFYSRVRTCCYPGAASVDRPSPPRSRHARIRHGTPQPSRKSKKKEISFLFAPFKVFLTFRLYLMFVDPPLCRDGATLLCAPQAHHRLAHVRLGASWWAV
jgi:hypothetical protein